MTQQTLAGQSDAERIALANMSPRYKRLDGLERWSNGTQYKGRPSWWDDSVPLWEREPCIVYPIVRISTDSNVDLCLGERRFPEFSVATTGATKAAAGDDQQTSPVDTALRNYQKLSRFPTACREALQSGQECGTVVALQGARNGVPFIELIPAKWCEQELDEHGELSKLTVQYPYLDEYQQRDGTWAVRAMLYRRVIDAQRDVVYKPAEANANGTAINWVEDKTKSADHGLGFVPVVWYAFMKGCQPVNVIDGKAIHQWVTDEIQAHDIARSQWHRGALLSEPQPYEIGVPVGHNPTDEGRTAMIPTTEHGGAITPDNPIRGGFPEGNRTKGARKKGPGHVWQYPNPDTEVGTLTYPGDALKSQQDNCSDLRIKLQEALCVVFLDPENIKFAATTSGKALEAIRQKQLDRCAQYREDFRDGFLIPCVKMQLRLMRQLGASLKVPGLKEALSALGKGEEADPDIEVRYGDFYTPDPTEQKALIELIALSAKEGLLDRESAIEKAAPILGVQNIEELKKRLEKQRAEDEEREIAELKRWSETGGNPSAVPGSPAKPPKGGDSGRPKDGKVNAGKPGQ